jgi:mevalonate kinase
MCVLTVRAFNRIYDLGLTTRDEMELAYQGETTTPSRCGRMDQGCAFGRRTVLMTFDGDQLGTTEIRVAGDFPFVVVDLCARKNTTEILARLHRSFPIPATEIDVGVHRLLGPTNRRIVGEAVAALRAGDRQGLGALMVEAQELFDRRAAPACPEELNAPVLHRVLCSEALQPHIWGGKGVGSQGDGSAQLLARSAADRQAVIEIVGRDLGMPCLQLDLGAVPAGGPNEAGEGS